MIRAFEHRDTAATANVWHRSGLQAYDYLPAFQRLDQASALEVFESVIVRNCDIWVYEINSNVLGFLAMQDAYIDRLYVDPTAQQTGIGTALLSHAKALCPQGLTLHTHEQNHGARRFYEKFGFVVVKFGVSPPPESVPDVEYRWHGQS